ncbi:MAG: DUF72 domain-containing protein [Thermoanaerobaculia bacterium]|nr:DUF72 domain-containing protein [Thermoanaerobaculia bacterium]
MGMIRIGVAGWSYDHWGNGTFYPENLPKKQRLEYVGKKFNSAEINGSFYSLLSPKTYENYRRVTPEGFLFAVKGSQFITHSKRLKDVGTPLANFYASGVLRLEEKLGPFLWQFPDAKWDIERLRTFIDLLPKDTREASRLARRHDQRVEGKASTAADGKRRIRHALEFRNEHFLTDEVVRICRDGGVALVFADSGKWPYLEELTSGFVYVRLHGSPKTYASNYGPKKLEKWEQRIRAWSDGREPDDPERITDRKPPKRKSRDVYVYFDNDGKGHAPKNASSLMERLGIDAAGE